jgi:hypothetical protein
LFERFKDVDRIAVSQNRDVRLPIQTILEANKVFPEFEVTFE